MQTKEELKETFEKLLFKRGIDPSFTEDVAEVISQFVEKLLIEAHGEGYTKGFEDATHLPI